jgi:hypothetical protein
MQEKITTKDVTVQELDSYNDSEFLALVIATLMGKDEEGYISDYVFNRIDKILKQMSKQEMN